MDNAPLNATDNLTNTPVSDKGNFPSSYWSGGSKRTSK